MQILVVGTGNDIDTSTVIGEHLRSGAGVVLVCESESTDSTDYEFDSLIDYLTQNDFNKHGAVESLADICIPFKDIDEWIEKKDRAYFNSLLLKMSEDYQFIVKECDKSAVIPTRKSFMSLKTFSNLRF